MVLKALTQDASAPSRLRAYESLKRGNPLHPGYPFVNTVLDSFSLETISGAAHEFLVQKPMWDTVGHILWRFSIGRFTEEILRTTLARLFLALDYIHSECKLVHTGEKAPCLSSCPPSRAVTATRLLT